ncbi:hypothetical protein PLICRDRAFT_124895 [Plicaturopsis crispa FD-325 SS-3]|nr:hypothetical protein PLICRDRAFT_124895 [Plicaturopsis crispa FD-325 SS-3]
MAKRLHFTEHTQRSPQNSDGDEDGGDDIDSGGIEHVNGEKCCSDDATSQCFDKYPPCASIQATPSDTSIQFPTAFPASSTGTSSVPSTTGPLALSTPAPSAPVEKNGAVSTHAGQIAGIAIGSVVFLLLLALAGGLLWRARRRRRRMPPSAEFMRAAQKSPFTGRSTPGPADDGLEDASAPPPPFTRGAWQGDVIEKAEERRRVGGM